VCVCSAQGPACTLAWYHVAAWAREGQGRHSWRGRIWHVFIASGLTSTYGGGPLHAAACAPNTLHHIASRRCRSGTIDVNAAYRLRVAYLPVPAIQVLVTVTDTFPDVPENKLCV
jgi:hypothetical protein